MKLTRMTRQTRKTRKTLYVFVVFGTRPEAIKLAPVILELKKYPKKFRVRVVVTAQHREMLDQVLKVFNIKPDIDLNLMEKDQTLAGFAAKALTTLDECFKKEKPDMVIVQGDTTTTLCASLAAFYNRIPVGHVEAGLRTDNKYSPFPEEINRILTTHIADLHFAPTKWAANNLLREGIPKSRIFVTGNTVIDALHIVQQQNLPLCKRGMKGDFNTIMRCFPKREDESGGGIKFFDSPSHRISDSPFVLITGHRRENFGQGFRNICLAIKTLAHKFPDYLFVYPVHLNPNVRKQVLKALKGERNIRLIEPVDYVTFVRLMANCTLILTDSGGIQEEAPAFGKPVLVMRDTTERPEAIWAGTAKLVGTDVNRIVREASRLLNKPDKQKKLNRPKVGRRVGLLEPNRPKRPNKPNRLRNPFGNGTAAKKIVGKLKRCRPE